MTTVTAMKHLPISVQTHPLGVDGVFCTFIMAISKQHWLTYLIQRLRSSTNAAVGLIFFVV